MKFPFAAILLSTTLIASAPLLAQQPASAPTPSPAAAPAPASTPATNAVPVNTITMGARTVTVPTNTQNTQNGQNAQNQLNTRNAQSAQSAQNAAGLNSTQRPINSTANVSSRDAARTNSVTANTTAARIDAPGTVPPATAMTPTNTNPSASNFNNYPTAPAFQRIPASAGGLMGMDLNGDGMLTKLEFMSHYEHQFDGMKKNTIGVVDLRRMQEEQTAQNEQD